MNIKQLFYLSVLSVLFFSCSVSSDATCSESRTAPIETVVEKESTDASKHLFDVGFRVTNSCGQLGSFGQNTVGNVTTVYINAKYEGCYCTQELTLRNEVYTFDQSVPGTYTIKFAMLENNFITKTIVIE